MPKFLANLANASPIGDTPPVILALNGWVHCQSSKTKRSINANEFFTDYRQTVLAKDECIVSVELPLLEEDEVLKVYKNSKRFDDDISTVCIAIWVKFNTTNQKKVVGNIRIACGGMAATIRRATNCEAAIVGNAWNEETIDAACKALALDFEPISDMRASAEYRLRAAQNLLRRFYLESRGEIESSVYAYGR